jgi:hypothetical protein
MIFKLELLQKNRDYRLHWRPEISSCHTEAAIFMTVTISFIVNIAPLYIIDPVMMST